MITRIKENLNDTTILNLMYSLGADRHIDNEDHIIFPTICHGGNSMKLYYYKGSKTFTCYTSCGSWDIIELIQKVLDVDIKESINFLSRFLGIRDIYIPKGFGSSSVIIEDFDDEEIEIPIIENENILNNFLDYYCCEWLSEDISIETMKKYNIKYYLHQHKIIIPHYNIDNQLIGIRGRALLTEDVESGRKYMPIYLNGKPYAHSLRHNLYGLNMNVNAIKKYKQVVLVESEKSVLKADSYYGEDSIVVAICGSNISRKHMEMLLELGVLECVIAFDKEFEVINDEGYILWKRKIKKIIDKYKDVVKITVIWDEKYNLLEYKSSPLDSGKETFELLFNNRIEFEEEENV